MTTSLTIYPHVPSVRLSHNGRTWEIVVEEEPKTMSWGTWAASLIMDGKVVAYLPTVKDHEGEDYKSIDLFKHVYRLIKLGVISYDAVTAGHNLLWELRNAINTVTVEQFDLAESYEDHNENTHRNYYAVPFSDGKYLHRFHDGSGVVTWESLEMSPPISGERSGCYTRRVSQNNVRVLLVADQVTKTYFTLPEHQLVSSIETQLAQLQVNGNDQAL